MKRAQRHRAGFHHQLRHLADAADVLHAVGVGEAEVLVQPVADVVAVEHHGVDAARVELGLDHVGDGRLAGAREAGEPQDRGLLVFQRRARLLGDGEVLVVDVGGAAQREVDQARARGGVGGAVDQDEGAGVAVLGVGVEGDRRRGGEVAEADLVQPQRLGGIVLQRVDVDPVLQIRDRDGHELRRRSSSGRSGRAAAAPRSSRSRGRRTGPPPGAAPSGRPAGRPARCRSRRRASGSRRRRPRPPRRRRPRR